MGLDLDSLVALPFDRIRHHLDALDIKGLDPDAVDLAYAAVPQWEWRTR